MPIPTLYEVLRLQVIADNHKKLQEALRHENSVYATINKKALLDADLHARTGRVRSPSPPPPSDSEYDVVVLSSESSEGAAEGAPSRRKDVCTCFQGSVNDVQTQEKVTTTKELPHPVAAAVLSEPLKDKLAPREPQCNEEEPLLPLESEESVHEADSDFIPSKQEDVANSSFTSATESDLHTGEQSKSFAAKKAAERKVEFAAEEIVASGVPPSLPKTSLVLKVPEENMVTRLKSKDLPEPWFSTTKSTASTRRPRQQSTISAATPDSLVEVVLDDSTKRRTRSTQKETMEVQSRKGKRKGKLVRKSAKDFVLPRQKVHLPDVEELRRKREEDAISCGRTVRTVQTSLNENPSPPIAEKSSIGNDNNDRNANQAAVAKRCSYLKSSALAISIGDLRRDGKQQLDKEAIVFLEKTDDNSEPVFRQRPGKEHVNLTEQEEVDAEFFCSQPQRKDHVNYSVVEEADHQEGLPNNVNLQHVPNYGASDRELNGKDGDRQLIMQRSSPPSKRKKPNNASEGRQYRQTLSPYDGRQSQWKRYYGRGSRSPPQRSLKRSRAQSPQRSRSSSSLGSPAQHRRRRQRRTRNELRDYYTREGRQADDDQSPINSWRDHNIRRRQESSSPGNSPRSSEYDSAESGRLEDKRVWTPHSSRKPTQSYRDIIPERPILHQRSTVREEEDIVILTPAMDRKERRRQQAIREAEKSKRMEYGKKPFYLTVDDEGKPYGPGKPAWIAEINKLAAGLDPSCTHIRKQTFEDVETFKNRLNENFDYSAALNGDYLRGLMGRAVTKKRGELLALIKSNGTQPRNIDLEVWKRLQNLANSKQTADKSQQGRHANACRKTFGRTGSIGMNGVREKLRLKIGRSPDPDEVEEEMQRDKGYGGQQRKMESLLVKREKTSTEVILSNDTLNVEEATKFLEGSCAREVQGESSRRRSKVVAEYRRHGEYGVQEMDVVAGRTRQGQKVYTVTETQKMSKDDYIEKLKAQIERLQAENAKTSTSNMGIPSQSELSAPRGSSD